MIKKLVIWYLKRIALEECVLGTCTSCPFGIRDEAGLPCCSIMNVVKVIESQKNFFKESKGEKKIMSMTEWAKREIEIACERERGDKPEEEWDYGCACYKSALKAFNSLCEDGHSGFSIGVTKQILNRLIDGKPLTPIEDTDDVWEDISSYGGLEQGVHKYQCKRMSSLFKDVYADGSVEYSDVGRCYCVDINNPNSSYTSGLVTKIIDELFPITMPYMPEDKPIKVYCEEFLTDRKNGDYDTVGVLYAIMPDGKRVEIHRYFGEKFGKMYPISNAEYESRRKMANDRIAREKNNG